MRKYELDLLTAPNTREKNINYRLYCFNGVVDDSHYKKMSKKGIKYLSTFNITRKRHFSSSLE